MHWIYNVPVLYRTDRRQSFWVSSVERRTQWINNVLYRTDCRQSFWVSSVARRMHWIYYVLYRTDRCQSFWMSLVERTTQWLYYVLYRTDRHQSFLAPHQAFISSSSRLSQIKGSLSRHCHSSHWWSTSKRRLFLLLWRFVSRAEQIWTSGSPACGGQYWRSHDWTCLCHISRRRTSQWCFNGHIRPLLWWTTVGCQVFSRQWLSRSPVSRLQRRSMRSRWVLQLFARETRATLFDSEFGSICHACEGRRRRKERPSPKTEKEQQGRE
jgi:hypothetical protein